MHCDREEMCCSSTAWHTTYTIAFYTGYCVVVHTKYFNMSKSNQSLLKLNVSHNDISDYKIVHVISETLTVPKNSTVKIL